MTSFRRLAALPILAALAFAAPTAQALSIRMEPFDASTVDGGHASASKLRARPAATQKSGKQSQGMVCTTRQTTAKVGLFRKLIKSKSITVCTPVKTTASNQPAGQGPVVETSDAGSNTNAGGNGSSGGNGNAGSNSNSSGNHNSGGSSNAGGNHNSGGSSSNSNSNSNSSGSSNSGGSSNAGGNGNSGSDGSNDTDEDTDDYVSDIIHSPPVFVPPAIGGDESEGSEGSDGDAPPLLAAVPPNSVPEPGTLALLGLGLAGLGLSRRRFTK